MRVARHSATHFSSRIAHVPFYLLPLLSALPHRSKPRPPQTVVNHKKLSPLLDASIFRSRLQRVVTHSRVKALSFLQGCNCWRHFSGAKNIRTLTGSAQPPNEKDQIHSPLGSFTWMYLPRLKFQNGQNTTASCSVVIFSDVLHIAVPLWVGS